MDDSERLEKKKKTNKVCYIISVILIILIILFCVFGEKIKNTVEYLIQPVEDNMVY